MIAATSRLYADPGMSFCSYVAKASLDQHTGLLNNGTALTPIANISGYKAGSPDVPYMGGAMGFTFLSATAVSAALIPNANTLAIDLVIVGLEEPHATSSWAWYDDSSPGLECYAEWLVMAI